MGDNNQQRLIKTSQRKGRFFCFKDAYGQGMAEYMIVFAIVIVAIFVIVKPSGFLTRGVQDALDVSITGIDCMTTGLPYDGAVAPAPWLTGGWGSCSVPCGGGVQRRSVSCPAGCCDGPAPRESRRCNTNAC